MQQADSSGKGDGSADNPWIGQVQKRAMVDWEVCGTPGMLLLLQMLLR